ncbi:kinase-like protein [Auricularia subglabra TFB-10046 SS5]|nr:kinase-like protein [Auricularia subglabra TFB-10046 SS5]
MPGIAPGFNYLHRTTANDLLAGRLYVVRTFIRDDEANRRKDVLKRAAAALARIHHLNGERLLELFILSDSPGRIVTLVAHGGTLLRYLEHTPRANRLEIALGVADGLKFLHADSIKKPYIIVLGNLHVTTVLMHGKVPLLSDFSQNRITPKPDDDGCDAATTPKYGMLTSMAPEIQDSAGARTTASDVFAFAVLLFELAADHRPFPEMRPIGAAVQLREGRRPSRGELRLGVKERAVWRIIARCWAQDPSSRPQMPAVYDDLRQLNQVRGSWAAALLDAARAVVGGWLLLFNLLFPSVLSRSRT